MTGVSKPYFVMGILMFIVNGLTLHEILAGGNETIYEEGEFVECISAFCFLVASILTFFRGFERCGLERKMIWIFSVTNLLFFIRELDLENLNIPSVLSTLGSGNGRDFFFTALFLGLFVSVFSSSRDRSELRLRTFFRPQVVQVCVVGGLLLVLGSVFEKCHATMIEEILEMNASLLILLAAILNERLPMSAGSRGRKPLVL